MTAVGAAISHAYRHRRPRAVRYTDRSRTLSGQPHCRMDEPTGRGRPSLHSVLSRRTERYPGHLDQVLGHATFEHRRVPGPAGTWWEQTRLPAAANADRLDVFFAPAYSAPLTLRMPLVLTLPDVSFFAHPEWFRWREGARRRWLARQAARQAARIVTISQFSRHEIAEHLDIPLHRIDVTLLGASPSATSPASSAEPLVLFVGSVFTRRHVPVLINAFHRVVDTLPDARLAIVGANRDSPLR